MTADLVTSQHVLEHVAEPRRLLDAVRRSLRPARPGRDPVLYLEVPDAGYMLAQGAVWDVIYEHCTYFDAGILARLLAATGFEVLDSGTSFAGQYLWVEARPGPREANGQLAAGDAGGRGEVADLAASFGQAYRAAVDGWRRQVGQMARDGRVVVWGAGSKGVSFLNAVDPGGVVSAVVDVNPGKHGLYVPGTGHVVCSPDDLASQPPRHVVLMNGVYEAEVLDLLAERGLGSAQVTVVGDPPPPPVAG